MLTIISEYLKMEYTLKNTRTVVKNYQQKLYISRPKAIKTNIKPAEIRSIEAMHLLKLRQTELSDTTPYDANRKNPADVADRVLKIMTKKVPLPNLS